MYKKIISFIGVIALLVGVIIYSAVTGSIDVSASELIKGLFTGSNENVEIIKDLRLPRIIISLFAGAALSVSGVDRKSTRLNSSHVSISYAVFCLTKKKTRE